MSVQSNLLNKVLVGYTYTKICPRRSFEKRTKGLSTVLKRPRLGGTTRFSLRLDLLSRALPLPNVDVTPIPQRLKSVHLTQCNEQPQRDNDRRGRGGGQNTNRQLSLCNSQLNKNVPTNNFISLCTCLQSFALSDIMCVCFF